MDQPTAADALASPSLSPLPIICLSHLRWRFVFQRPQHLMTRFARDRRVFYVEEAVHDASEPGLSFEHDPSGVTVVTPHVRAGAAESEVVSEIAPLLAGLMRAVASRGYVLWFLTPMALDFARDLQPAAIVYDCMDDLSSFAFAPPALAAREAELLARADVVFTGGRSLYEARRARHANIHCCPSSVDLAHFRAARRRPKEPDEQRPIARPRIGFAGVIDERMDLDLLRGLADSRPEWQIVLIGPVAKIDPESIPARANVHRLGAKPYAELPTYLAHWQIGMLPFAHNAATRFISPTKTPEYLAAGLPVVATSIRDVVTPYGELGLVSIADRVDDFVRAIDALLAADAAPRQSKVDAYLSRQSWDQTWAFMRDQLDAVLGQRPASTASRRLESAWPRAATVMSSPEVGS